MAQDSNPALESPFLTKELVKDILEAPTPFKSDEEKEACEVR